MNLYRGRFGILDSTSKMLKVPEENRFPNSEKEFNFNTQDDC